MNYGWVATGLSMLSLIFGCNAHAADVKFTPRACIHSTITTGGTAVAIATGPSSGGYVYNGANLTQQGIGATETLYLDPTTSPGSTDSTANGTSYPDATDSIYTIPPLAAGQTLMANAASSGHKFTCVVW